MKVFSPGMTGATSHVFFDRVLKAMRSLQVTTRPGDSGREVLCESRAPATLDKFRHACELADGIHKGQEQMPGNPWITLYDGDGAPLVTLRVINGYAIRWQILTADARLADGDRLRTWLVENGVLDALNAYELRRFKAWEKPRAALVCYMPQRVRARSRLMSV